jgi:hypothetical protein
MSKGLSTARVRCFRLEDSLTKTACEKPVSLRRSDGRFWRKMPRRPRSEVFWYCLVCTSEYAEARVDACVEVVSFLSQRVGRELYLNEATAGKLDLA